jgi:hypothetical protein
MALVTAGYIRMPKEEEHEVRDFITMNFSAHSIFLDTDNLIFSHTNSQWIDTMNAVHASVKGGMKYNTGKLLMVLYRPIEMEKE